MSPERSVPKVRIGSAADNEIVIDGEHVEAHHCEIYMSLDTGTFSLSALSGSEGRRHRLSVNGFAVLSPFTPLAVTDSLRVGGVPVQWASYDGPFCFAPPAVADGEE